MGRNTARYREAYNGILLVVQSDLLAWDHSLATPEVLLLVSF